MKTTNKFGHFICKYRKAILIISLILLIPSIIGIKATKINYDILTYLPKDIETIEGQEILAKDFNLGSFSILIVDDKMPTKDILKMEEKIKEIDCVDKVIGASDILGTTIPKDMLPDDIKDELNKQGTTPILVTFTSGMGEEDTINAITKIREIADSQCKVSGISAMATDIKYLLDSEMALYVVIAVVLCIIILELALDSFAVPVILLVGIGMAVLYNMGSNVMLGQISYLTKAVASVLQLGVTMDFSIFLYHSYQKEKASSKDIYEAMAKAINSTLVSVLGSSLTTIAGFLALCTMKLEIGKDIGLVMAKGVLIGLISVVTIVPAMILVFDKLIQKTKHKEILPQFKHLQDFVVKHYKIITIIFVILAIPAIYGNANVKVYYNLNKSLPDTLLSTQANNDLSNIYNMKSTQIVLVDKNLKDSTVNNMLEEIDKLDGVEWSISKSKITNGLIPNSVLPDDIKDVFESDKYQLVLINSSVENATDEANELINTINGIVKKYDESAILAGEGPLMKDLVEIADIDFNSVNITSILVIFVIMIFVFKSPTIPVLLIAVIEFAIFVNMSVAFYTKQTLPFVASIIIGTIQLGATVDYAILMTNKFLDARIAGKTKKEAVYYTLDNSIKSIIVSASCFFAATCGVSIISDIDLVGAICTLISRGAIISMISVIFVLPSLLIIFDKLICKTTKRTRNANIRF